MTHIPSFIAGTLQNSGGGGVQSLDDLMPYFYGAEFIGDSPANSNYFGSESFAFHTPQSAPTLNFSLVNGRASAAPQNTYTVTLTVRCGVQYGDEDGTAVAYAQAAQTITTANIDNINIALSVPISGVVSGKYKYWNVGVTSATVSVSSGGFLGGFYSLGTGIGVSGADTKSFHFPIQAQWLSLSLNGFPDFNGYDIVCSYTSTIDGNGGSGWTYNGVAFSPQGIKKAFTAFNAANGG